MRPAALFVGSDGRVRPIWRIVLFIALFIAGGVLSRPFMVPLRPWTRDSGPTGWLGGVALTAYATAIGLLVHAAALRWIDRRPWSYVGLDRSAASPRLLVIGWLLGAVPIAAVSLLLMAVGWLKVVPALPGSWLEAAARMSMLLLFAAFLEELLSRGYIFATLREWLGTPVAVGLTSIVFGLLHGDNPGANPLPLILVTIGGVNLAVVLVVTRSLYAAWMAHWAWNWVMAVLFHVQVSGIFIPRPDYKTIELGPDWLTGGAWGPEGSVLAGIADLIVIAALIRYGVSRRRASVTG